MKFKEWLKNQIVGLSVAISNVEKNVLGQEKSGFDNTTRQQKRHQEGTLADSLLHGEVTEEVRNLRWRNYKILKATEGMSLKSKYVDEDGDIHYDVIKKNNKQLLNNIILDNYDTYPLEMVIMNDKVTVSGIDVFEILKKNFNQFENSVKNVNENGDLVATHGEIKSEDYFATIKPERPIKVVRTFFPKFEIENFTKKLTIRKISETERLLEFYVSKYPDEYNLNSNLLIKELKNIMSKPTYATNILDLVEVNFVTSNTIGAEDFLYYSYKVLSFDKIVEFDGNYIIKFKCEIIDNGKDILEDYREEELDKKYELKLRR